MDWRQFAQVVKQHLFPPLKGLPGPIYTELVVKWKQPHETLEQLRCVTQTGETGGRRVTLIRIVDPTELRRRGLTVREYVDLDGHSAAVWYEGWWDPRVPEVRLTPVSPAPKAR